MKKIIAIVSAICMLTGSAAQAYELPHSFWEPNNSYSAATEAEDLNKIIQYGNEVLGIIRNEPNNEQTADIMGSRLYEVGNAYERLGEYEKAAKCFEEYIPYGEQRGWKDGVKIAKDKVMQFTPTAELYTPSNQVQKYYDAINEPLYGTLVGQTSDSETLGGESMILLYQEYGAQIMPWISLTLDNAKKSGRAVEVALNFPREGNQIQEIINDNSFLSSFIDILARYPDIPIYLRIGAEVNIWQTKADAEQFKRAFRKIADSAHSRADNIATVWSVGHTSGWDVDMNDYYPGDEYVDWVGISAYCKKYFEGKIWDVEKKFNEICFKTGDSSDPVLLIKEVVDRYGNRKPIMLAECGLAHHTSSSAISEEHTDWAVTRLEQMYTYIPMVYPQVKLIAYFNKHMPNETEDYALSRNDSLNAKYKEVIKLPHFINGKYASSASTSYKHLGSEVSAAGSITLLTYPHIFGSDKLKVDYYIDGKWVNGSSSVGYERTIDLNGYSDGAHELKTVVESDGQIKFEKKITLNISNIKVKINGNYVNADVPPFIENDRTYVPVRLISENLGCNVNWEQASQTAVVERDGTEIRMTLGSQTIRVNNEERTIDSPVQMKNDRMFLPIRAVSEILGASVDWDGSERCVIVNN